jgi:hypothetical protein
MSLVPFLGKRTPARFMGRSESRILLCPRGFAAIPPGFPLCPPTSWVESFGRGCYEAPCFLDQINTSSFIDFVDFYGIMRILFRELSVMTTWLSTISKMPTKATL